MRRVSLQPPLIWHDYLLAWIFGSFAAAWFVPSLAALAALVIFDGRLRAHLRLGLIFFLFAVAFSVTHWRAEKMNFSSQAAPAWTKTRAELRGKIVRVQETPDNVLRLWLTDVKPADAKEALPGYCLWTWVEPPPNVAPLPGQDVKVFLKPYPIRGYANFDLPDSSFGYRAQGIYWRLYGKKMTGNPVVTGKPAYFAALREKIKKDFIRILQADGKKSLSQARAMLLGLLFGDRSRLSRETVADFASAALAHSLALSGQHLSVAALLAFLAVIGVARFWPGAYLLIQRTALIALVSLPFVILYLWLGAAPASLQRAACMAGVLALWLALGKSFSGIDLLCAALLILLTINPLGVYDIGLQLSALCLAILLLSGPAFERARPKLSASTSHWSKFLHVCLRLLLTSLIIQIFLLPLTLSRFYLAGFWFPFNLIWLPALGFIVLPFAALALVLSAVPHCAAAASVAVNVAEFPCEIILRILLFLRENGALSESAYVIPYWTAYLAFAILFFCLAWSLSRKICPSPRLRTALVLALFLLAVGPALRFYHSFTSAVSLEILDVGVFGRALLVNFPGGGKILVDTGGSVNEPDMAAKRVIIPVISANRHPALDAIAVSDSSPAGSGGLRHALSKIYASQCFSVKPPKNSGCVQLKRGDKIFLGPESEGLYLEARATPRAENPNASLTLALTRDDRTLALVPGNPNIGKKKRDRIRLAEYPAVVVPGKKNRETTDLTERDSPRLVVFSGRRGPVKYAESKNGNKRAPLILDTNFAGEVRLEFGRNEEIKLTTAREIEKKNGFPKF